MVVIKGENKKPEGHFPIPDVVNKKQTVNPDLQTTIRFNSAFPLLAHYKGGVPESMIKAGGIDRGFVGLISPWYKDRFAGGEFSLSNIMTKENHGSVIIPESGLYFIYAQVYYLSPEFGNSYSIVTVDERDRERVLSTCSIPSGEIGESSCFTGAARFLRKGEQLQLHQRERNRHILLRQGQTFLGIVLLSPSRD